MTKSLGQQATFKIATCLALVVLAGCFRNPESNPVAQGRPDNVEDGGSVENADRDRAQEYFSALGDVESAEEEAKLLNDFGEWLRQEGFAVRVEVKNGKHDLSCPYFPPVTPWTSHSFIDIKNLELLPRLEDAEGPRSVDKNNSLPL